MFENFTHLALDQAPRVTGWALGAPDMREPLTGTLVLPPVGARHGKMLRPVHVWLSGMIASYDLKKIIFETPFLVPGPTGNVGTYALQNKLIGVIEQLCEEHELEVTEVTPSRWRAHFIGPTAAPRYVPKLKRRQWLKNMAVEACARRSWFVRSHDAAEAAGILDYALSTDFPDYGARSTPLFVRGDAA